MLQTTQCSLSVLSVLLISLWHDLEKEYLHVVTSALQSTHSVSAQQYESSVIHYENKKLYTVPTGRKVFSKMFAQDFRSNRLAIIVKHCISLLFARLLWETLDFLGNEKAKILEMKSRSKRDQSS